MFMKVVAKYFPVIVRLSFTIFSKLGPQGRSVVLLNRHHWFNLEVTFFFLLLTELLASFFADTAALKPAHKITNWSDEKIPLMSEVHGGTLRKDGRPVSKFVLCKAYE